MPAEAKIDELTGAAAVPRKNGELVFDAPWQSRAFGMAVGLHRKGLFSWDEFRDRLIAKIAAHPGEEGADSPASVYYGQWLAALEGLLVEKGVLSQASLASRTRQLASGERA